MLLPSTAGAYESEPTERVADQRQHEAHNRPGPSSAGTETAGAAQMHRTENRADHTQHHRHDCTASSAGTDATGAGQSKPTYDQADQPNSGARERPGSPASNTPDRLLENEGEVRADSNQSRKNPISFRHDSSLLNLLKLLDLTKRQHVNLSVTIAVADKRQL